MAKTVRQIADEIGVSKTAVMKQIANLGLQTSLRKDGNQFAIDEQQEALILQGFQKKSQTESQTENDNQSQTVSALVVALQKELDIKNEQIRELNARLADTTSALLAAQQTAQAAQALHAGTIQQQLTDGTRQGGFFSRIFRRKERKENEV